jgi:hypothetical protein
VLHMHVPLPSHTPPVHALPVGKEHTPVPSQPVAPQSPPIGRTPRCFRAALLAPPLSAEEVLAKIEAKGHPWAEAVTLHTTEPTGTDVVFAAPCRRRARAPCPWRPRSTSGAA